MKVRGLTIEKCQLENKTSLVLSYKNYDPTAASIAVIFKDGEGLQHDIMCLQLIEVMRRAWCGPGPPIVHVYISYVDAHRAPVTAL